MSHLDPDPANPPWVHPAQWLQANDALTRLCAARSSELGALRHEAAQLLKGLEFLFQVLDQLCAETCAFCKDPCCLHARPWFDFKDLVFMHVAALSVPLSQVLTDFSSPCRFAGPQGCTLPRLSRPWICTWYICPAQKELLGRVPAPVRSGFQKGLEEIKEGRKRLEDGFIALVCSRPGS